MPCDAAQGAIGTALGAQSASEDDARLQDDAGMAWPANHDQEVMHKHCQQGRAESGHLGRYVPICSAACFQSRLISLMTEESPNMSKTKEASVSTPQIQQGSSAPDVPHRLCTFADEKIMSL